MSSVIRLAGVTLPGSGYPTLKSFEDVTPALPVSSGLLGLYVLRNAIGHEVHNYAPGGAPLTQVGSPVLHEFGADCNAGNYYDTGIQAQPAATVIAIAAPQSAPSSLNTSMPILSGYTGVNTYGAGDVFWLGTNYSNAGQNVGAGASTPGDGSTAAGSPGAYQTLALPAAEPIAVFGTFAGAPDRHAVGLLSTPGGALQKTSYPSGAPTFPRPAAPFGPTLRLGASPFGFAGESRVLLVAYFNRVLSDAEILQNLEYLRGVWGVQHGIWS